jgi:hypothetical protein
MAITPTDVTRAFSVVSGSTNLLNNNLTVTYIKNSNAIPADMPMTVANASADFYIKVSPVPSTPVLEVYRSGSTTLVNTSTPLIIPPTSSRELVVRLSTTLENFEVQTRPESITFNLVAMVPSSASTNVNTNSNTTTSGTTSNSGGGGTSQSDSTSSETSSQF